MQYSKIFTFILTLVASVALNATDKTDEKIRVTLFETTGRYQGLLRPKYQQAFSLADAIAINCDHTFINGRLYLAVGTEKEGLKDIPNTGNLKNFYNFRQKNPDSPVDNVGYITQRFIPTQDGTNPVANQLGRDDPVSHFTPETIGTILNLIRNFYFSPPKDKKAFAQKLAFKIDRNLNSKYFNAIGATHEFTGTTEQIRDAIKIRQGMNKHKKIADFAKSLVQALDDANDKPVYYSYYVHNALLAFALKKAVRNPAKAMMDLYSAMPDVVVENFQKKLKQPFSKKQFTELKERIYTLFEPHPNDQKKKQEFIKQFGEKYRLPPREELCFFSGKRHVDNLFPVRHYYGRSKYKGRPFSTCGEISWLNTLNMFLYNFAQKRLRAELLDDLPNIIASCKAFYRRFPTEIDQQSQEGLQAWINLISGHDTTVDPDIHYVHENCAVSNGLSSLTGIIRALLPDKTNDSIRKNHKLTPLQRARATLQHLVELFSSEQEKWDWSILDAPPG